MNKITISTIVALGVLTLSGCQVKPPPGTFALSPTSLEDRQIQSRFFETKDEVALLSAGIGVLQDMGYTLDESEKSAGLLTASKTVDATDAGQIAVAILVAFIGVQAPIDSKQNIKVSFVTYPSKIKKGFIARATFQRVVLDLQGNVSRVETMKNPELYQDFYVKLSKSVFLEAYSI